MNTKEHINSLKELIICKGCTLEISQETVDTIKEVIELLRRGEKHEKIVEEMKRFTNVMTMDIANDKIFEFEQKYFPKPIKDKDYFYVATSKDPHLRKMKFKKGGSQ